MSETTPEAEGTQIIIMCTSCGEELDQAERDAPLGGEHEAALCDECYREFYEFTCCWCEDDDDDDYQHVLLVVFDAYEACIALPGVYRIDAMPYFSQPLIGHGRLWDNQLTWLGYLPGCHSDGLPCGHLCRRCQALALADCRYGTRCGVAALAGGHL
jgi:hypothetical protein